MRRDLQNSVVSFVRLDPLFSYNSGGFPESLPNIMVAEKEREGNREECL